MGYSRQGIPGGRGRWVPRLADWHAVFAVAVGLLVLAGWALDLSLLKSVLPGQVSMKANTAFSFVLLGLSLWLRREGRSEGAARRAAGLLAAAVVCVAGLTLAEYAAGWDLPVDDMLFTVPPGAVATAHPGRMAVNTACCFVLLGIALLLAEDNPNDVELTLEALAEKNLANEVVVARDGAEALDYLRRQGPFAMRAEGNPAVILLDIKMPKVDGLQVLREVRADEGLRAIPVVIMTSSREEKDLVESYRLGVNAYVVKPVDFGQFVEAVKQVGAFWAVVNEPPPGSARPKR